MYVYFIILTYIRNTQVERMETVAIKWYFFIHSHSQSEMDYSVACDRPSPG